MTSQISGQDYLANMPESHVLKITVEDSVAVLTLRREEKRNAINDDLRDSLISALDWAAIHHDIHAIVLTGSGKSFCAGGDIQGMKERLQSPAGDLAINGWHRQRRNNLLITKLHGLSKPTVAAVNGAAAGLGCDIALACDFIIGSTQSFYIMSFVLRGLIPDGGGMYFLPRRVGLAQAKEIIFSGRRVEHDEALKIGMIDRICSNGDLVVTAVDFAKNISQASSTSIALAKSVLDKTFEKSLEEVLALGCQAQAICYTSDEHRLSVEAFLNQNKNS